MEKTAEQLRREHIALEGDTHGKNKWAILFTVLAMTFMACLDASIVTVALPVMQKELGVGLDRIQLVSSAYLLATCVAMLPFGRLGDVHGKVNVFQLGVIVFTGGSLLCGLSASLEVLILARFVQGIGCPLSNQMEHGHVRNAEDDWFLGWPDRVLEPEKHFGAVRTIQSAISSIMNSLLTHRKTGAPFFAQFSAKCAIFLIQNHG